MPLAVDDIVLKVAREGAFDTTTEDASSTAILGWVNAARSEAIGEAKWMKALVSLGNTTAGTADYAVPDSVVKLESLRVGSSRPYLRVGWNDLWEAESSGVWRVTGPHDGAFAPTANSDGDSFVRLLPAPDVSGLAIQASAAILPAELAAAGAAATVRLPRDMVEPICVDGAIAIGYLRVKGDAEGGAAFQARFEGAKGKLKARANSRIGGGPVQIRLSR